MANVDIEQTKKIIENKTGYEIGGVYDGRSIIIFKSNCGTFRCKVFRESNYWEARLSINKEENNYLMMVACANSDEGIEHCLQKLKDNAIKKRKAYMMSLDILNNFLLNN